MKKSVMKKLMLQQAKTLRKREEEIKDLKFILTNAKMFLDTEIARLTK